MNANQSTRYLRCTSCSTESLSHSGENIECGECGTTFRVEKEKVFFVEPPHDTPKPKNRIEDVIQKDRWSSWRVACYEHLTKYLDPLPDSARVLDLGAGRSFYRDDFNARFQEFLSVDFHPHQLIDVVADISGPLPLRDEMFDAVILANVLEHMPDPAITLNECCRVLKQGGILVAETPFLMSLHDEPYDFNRFTKYMIPPLLSKSGFGNIKVENLSSIFDVYTAAQRDFFGTLLKSSAGLGRLRLRFLRKIYTVGLRFITQNERSQKEERVPKGYGFFGRKK